MKIYLILFFLATIKMAQAASQLKSVVFDAGGGVAASGSSKVHISIGELAGNATSSGSKMNAGFVAATKSNQQPPTPVVVTLELYPSTINRKSQGNFVTAYLESGSAEIANLKTLSVHITKVNGNPVAIPAQSQPKPVFGDVDGDGKKDWTFKFDRQSLITSLPQTGFAGITIEGEFLNGSKFIAKDILWVNK